MLRTLRNLGRITGIVRTIARHDALFLLAESNTPFYVKSGIALITIGARPTSKIASLRKGEKLALALQILGPGFIKLGQALSVRSDLVRQNLIRPKISVSFFVLERCESLLRDGSFQR